MDVQQLSCKKDMYENVRDLHMTHHIIITMLLLRTVPFLDKRPCEDPHESCQTHQLHPKFFQHTINCAVKLGPAPVQFVVHHLRQGRQTPSTSFIVFPLLHLIPQFIQSLCKPIKVETATRGYSLFVFTCVWMPASDAFFRPRTPGLLEITTTISAELDGCLACSISACKLVPGTNIPEDFKDRE